jgi:hypothetical protein
VCEPRWLLHDVRFGRSVQGGCRFERGGGGAGRIAIVEMEDRKSGHGIEVVGRQGHRDGGFQLGRSTYEIGVARW